MTSRLTWFLKWVVPVVGVSLLAGGLLLPLPDRFWDSAGFAVNIVSSLTAACFGVPIAFFLLQRMLKSQESTRTKQLLSRQLSKSIEKIRSESVELAGGAEMVAALRDFTTRAAKLRGLLSLIDHTFGLIGAPTVDIPKSHLDEIESLFDQIVWGWSDRPIPIPEAQESSLATVHLHWSFVSQEIIPQARLNDLDLMSDVSVSRLDEKIGKHGPFHSFRLLLLENRGYDLMADIRRTVQNHPSDPSKILMAQPNWDTKERLTALQVRLVETLGEVESFLEVLAELESLTARRVESTSSV